MPRLSRRSLAPSVPINLKKCWLVLFRTLFKTSLSFMFLLVLLNGWKKYATLLPNNWLAKTPKALALMRLGSQSAERERVSEINWKFFVCSLKYLSIFTNQDDFYTFTFFYIILTLTDMALS
ncbi:hypothetical protein ACQ5SI_07920 [Peribacillus frigoritolerans]|uniref:hypothetical protein n=1 Tax=Peribacillus frigoritolerans TaxID=450367 RepID=UPI003D33AC44